MKNDPAYPVVIRERQFIGLTKREVFAMAAMQSILNHESDPTDMRTIEKYAKDIAESAIIYADALIAELLKEER